MGRGFIPLLMPVPVKTRGLETRPPEHLITREEGQVHTVPPRRLHIPALPPAPIFVVTHRHVELVFGPCRVGLGRESVWGGAVCQKMPYCRTLHTNTHIHRYTTTLFATAQHIHTHSNTQTYSCSLTPMGVKHTLRNTTEAAEFMSHILSHILSHINS